MRNGILTRPFLLSAERSLVGCTLTPEEARDIMMLLRDLANTVLKCVDVEAAEVAYGFAWPMGGHHARRQLAGSDTAASSERAGAELTAPGLEP